MVRGILTALAIAISLVILAVGGVAAFDAYDHWAFARRSPLAANLPRASEDGGLEFSLRVRESFSVGTAASNLERVLSVQGFVRTHLAVAKTTSDGSEPADTLMSNAFWLNDGPGLNIVCRPRWKVAWAVDCQDRISRLEASYLPACL